MRKEWMARGKRQNEWSGEEREIQLRRTIRKKRHQFTFWFITRESAELLLTTHADRLRKVGEDIAGQKEEE